MARYFHTQFIQIFKDVVKNYENVSIKFFSTDEFFSFVGEMYGIMTNVTNIFLPWILPNYDKCIYLKWNTVINGDLSAIYNQDLNGFSISAAKDIFMQGVLNNGQYRKNKDGKRFCQKFLGVKDTSLLANDTVILMSLKEMRKLDFKEVIKVVLHFVTRVKRGLNQKQLFNAFYYNKIKWMPQMFNYFVTSNSQIKNYMSDASANLLNEYKQATDKVVVYSYDPNMPWHLDGDTDIKFFMNYWKTINDGGFAPIFQTYFQIRFLNAARSSQSVKRQ